MSSTTDLGIMLIEFDSLKGPIIRKYHSSEKNSTENEIQEEILMWVLRANEFSFKKHQKKNLYARAIELNDPNFKRKKRQFGIALITSESIRIESIEQFLESFIQECNTKNNNQPYFRMLNGLIQNISSVPLESIKKRKEEKETRINVQTHLTVEELEKKSMESEIPYLLISNKLQIIQSIRILFSKLQTEIVIGHPEAYEANNHKIKTLNISNNDIHIEIDLINQFSEGIKLGVELFCQILGNLSTIENITNRIIVTVEFFDRLLLENVDVQYYLPFTQYLLSMENYTFTEYNESDFQEKMDELRETHGDWIDCLVGKNLTGKKLESYFKITGIKREALELLIDLLFVKLILIF